MNSDELDKKTPNNIRLPNMYAFTGHMWINAFNFEIDFPCAVLGIPEDKFPSIKPHMSLTLDFSCDGIPEKANFEVTKIDEHPLVFGLTGTLTLCGTICEETHLDIKKSEKTCRMLGHALNPADGIYSFIIGIQKRNSELLAMHDKLTNGYET